MGLQEGGAGPWALQGTSWAAARAYQHVGEELHRVEQGQSVILRVRSLFFLMAVISYRIAGNLRRCKFLYK